MKTDDEKLYEALKRYDETNWADEFSNERLRARTLCDVLRNYVFICNNRRLLIIYDCNTKGWIHVNTDEEAKEFFLDQIIYLKNWRYDLAKPRPDEVKRYLRAAKALSELHAYVKNMNPDASYFFGLLRSPRVMFNALTNDILLNYGLLINYPTPEIFMKTFPVRCIS